MSAFLSGVSYPFKALAILNRRSSLWGYVIVPILVNLVVGTLLYASLLVVGLQQIDAWVAGLTGAMALLGWLLRLLLIIVLLIVVGFLLVRFGVVLGSPWYGRLSEELEQLQLGQAPPAEPLTPAGIARDLSRAVQFELKKLALVLPVGLGLLLLNFLPFVGQVVGTAGGIALGATITCLDFFDGPLERRRLRFREKLAFVRNHFPASAGFGLICLGLVSIPLVNLIAIPLCVTAGTLFFCEQFKAAQPRTVARTIEQRTNEQRDSAV
jgi:CysZ protein